MNATNQRSRPMRTRSLQRLVHLVTGSAIANYVYFTPDPDSLFTTGVRWVAFPALALSGVAMWQWARLRRRLKTRRTTQQASEIAS